MSGSSTDAAPEWRSEMVDVSGLSLTDVLASAAERPADDTALGHCLRRLAGDLAHPGEPIAGFNSAL